MRFIHSTIRMSAKKDANFKFIVQIPDLLSTR